MANDDEDKKDNSNRLEVKKKKYLNKWWLPASSNRPQWGNPGKWGTPAGHYNGSDDDGVNTNQADAITLAIQGFGLEKKEDKCSMDWSQFVRHESLLTFKIG